jgi:hypothetical protein
MNQPELDLTIDQGDVPDEPFKDWLTECIENDTFEGWNKIMQAFEDADKAYPVETMPLPMPRCYVYLRQIQPDVWLWGATWYKSNSGGGGFAPLRKWGKGFAATTKAAAIDAARLYVAEKLKGMG